jgi:hypothetical protein
MRPAATGDTSEDRDQSYVKTVFPFLLRVCLSWGQTSPHSSPTVGAHLGFRAFLLTAQEVTQTLAFLLKPQSTFAKLLLFETGFHYVTLAVLQIAI